MNIDRCYCYQRTFSELKAIAEEAGVDSIDALQDRVLFGQNCQLCHPYVRRMLETGETVFDEILNENVE